MSKPSTILLYIISMCLISMCVVIGHEMWAKQRYQEYLDNTESAKRFLNTPDEKITEEMEKERSKGNPYSWLD